MIWIYSGLTFILLVGVLYLENKIELQFGIKNSIVINLLKVVVILLICTIAFLAIDKQISELELE